MRLEQNTFIVTTQRDLTPHLLGIGTFELLKLVLMTGREKLFCSLARREQLERESAHSLIEALSVCGPYDTILTWDRSIPFVDSFITANTDTLRHKVISWFFLFDSADQVPKDHVILLRFVKFTIRSVSPPFDAMQWLFAGHCCFAVLPLYVSVCAG